MSDFEKVMKVLFVFLTKLPKNACIYCINRVELNHSISEQWMVLMQDNQFFKPTVLYKEYMILDMIEKNSNITQREMSTQIGIAVSMINEYLDQYEKDKLIKRKKHSTKTVEYFVTKKGVERKKLLNIGYLKSSQILYDNAKDNIEQFLTQLQIKGRNNIYLYGAGEVAEILLHAIYSSDHIKINILGVIDDDASKIGKTLYNVPIVSLESVKDDVYDGILISSYTNKNTIINKLTSFNYDTNKIYNFFDL